MATFRPRPALRDRVLSIAVVEGAGEQTVLPGASAVLGLQFRGRVRAEQGLLSTAGVTGIQSTARRYRYLGETGSVLVRFKPQGAACLGVTGAAIAGQSVALEDLLPAWSVRQLSERVVDSQSAAERVALLEEFLLGLPYSHDRLIARAMELLAAGGEEATVAQAARALGLSERQLERRFLQRVGVSPKRYATLARFERAVELARGATSLTHAALDAGYYDQSHFIRDFTRFAGGPPGQILRRP